MKPCLAIVVCLLAAAPALAQQTNTPTPSVHPSDLNTGTAQQRIDELRRSGNTADQPQLNSLESTQKQGRNMNDASRLTGTSTSLSPTPPQRPDSSRATFQGLVIQSPPGHPPGSIFNR